MGRLLDTETHSGRSLGDDMGLGDCSISLSLLWVSSARITFVVTRTTRIVCMYACMRELVYVRMHIVS